MKIALSSGFRDTGRLQVDGAQIHYEVCGQGPAIVFAHGLGGNQTGIAWALYSFLN